MEEKRQIKGRVKVVWGAEVWASEGEGDKRGKWGTGRQRETCSSGLWSQMARPASGTFFLFIL